MTYPGGTWGRVCIVPTGPAGWEVLHMRVKQPSRNWYLAAWTQTRGAVTCNYLDIMTPGNVHGTAFTMMVTCTYKPESTELLLKHYIYL